MYNILLKLIEYSVPDEVVQREWINGIIVHKI